MRVEITLGTLIKQPYASTTTILTFKVIFSFLNESKGVWVTFKLVCTSKLDIWLIPKNTFGMYRIIAICTIVEPMLWVAFFFTNITIIFTGVIFRSITESEGMLMLYVPCGLWYCSIFEVQSKFASGTMEYWGNFRITTTTIMFRFYAREKKSMLMTMVGKDV